MTAKTLPITCLVIFSLFILVFFAGQCHAKKKSSDSAGEKSPFDVTEEIQAPSMITQVVGGEEATTTTAGEKTSIEMGKSYLVPRYKTSKEAEESATERGMGVLYFVESAGASGYYESEEEAYQDMSNRSLGEPYRIRTKIQKKAASRGYQ